MSCNLTCQEANAERCQFQTNPVFVAVYSVVCITGITLNFMALTVFFCCTKSRSHTIVYMTNLAIADLLLVCTLPLRIHYHLGFQGLSQKVCEVAGVILLANMYGSILLLTCVSLDRCMAVCFPMSSRVREGRKKAPVVCLGIWMLTIGASLQSYLANTNANTRNQTTCFNSIPKYAFKLSTLASSLTIGFGIPLIIMVLCSCGLVHAVTKSTAAQMSGLIDNCKIQRMLRKPLIEKRRRERINSSLEQLKGIMVDAYNLDQSKLEKADVLEITVQHMEGLQRGLGPAASQGASVAFESRQRYSSGYIQCMHEVHNLLLNCSGMDKSLGARLLNHLLKALPQISGESGATGSAAITSPLPLPTSPTHSPLTLPSFQPRSLQLHTPPSPMSPPSPSSPHCSPGILLQREGAGMRPSPPRTPSPQPLAPTALPPTFPGGDPSMWRPW